MLRADLEDAGIAYSDDAGRVVDFHALRHTFISNLAAGGVHPKRAQELARHSTIMLTMDHYTHVSRSELADALDVLPDVSSTGAETVRATGTYGEETVQKGRGNGADSVLPEYLPEYRADKCISTQFGALGEALSGVCKAQENPEKHRIESTSVGSDATAPGGTRTHDRRIRNPVLYPTELPAH